MSDVTHSPPGSTGVTTATILAAGLGTRLKPWTKHHPKALAMVNGKSLLQRNIEYLQQAGIYNIIINVHHFAGQVIDALQAGNGWGSTYSISDETDAVLETGGGLQKAAPLLAGNQHFVLMNVDVLTNLPLETMIDFHLQHQPLATLATTNRASSRYFLFDGNDRLSGWTNTTTGQQIITRGQEPLHRKAFSGIHIISSRIFGLMTQQGKFSMVDLYLALSSSESILSFDHSGSLFIDVGRPESIERAAAMFP